MRERERERKECVREREERREADGMNGACFAKMIVYSPHAHRARSQEWPKGTGDWTRWVGVWAVSLPAGLALAAEAHTHTGRCPPPPLPPLPPSFFFFKLES